MSEKQNKSKEFENKLYGIATVGEKGQVVIPNEARKQMGIEKGEKLVVFEAHEGTLALAKISAMERAAEELSKYVSKLQKGEK